LQLYEWTRKKFHALNSSGIRPCVRDLYSLEEFGRDCCIQGYTLYIKIYRRQLLEKWCSVWESRTTFKIDMLWQWKRREQSSDIYIEGCQECVCSICDKGARYPVQ